MEPIKPAMAAGIKAPHRMSTFWLNWYVAKAVPQMAALLLVPTKVAGGADGNVAKSAGTKMRPPPPTIESTMPANKDATETISNSMKKKRRLRGACQKSHLVLDVHVRVVWVSPLPSKRTQTAVHRVNEM
jgi:hypothetical protein